MLKLVNEDGMYTDNSRYFACITNSGLIYRVNLKNGMVIKRNLGLSNITYAFTYRHLNESNVFSNNFFFTVFTDCGGRDMYLITLFESGAITGIKFKDVFDIDLARRAIYILHDDDRAIVDIVKVVTEEDNITILEFDNSYREVAARVML